MPLPAALLARLRKRGIVDQPAEAQAQAPVSVPSSNNKTDDTNEEVFAEDYDDPSKPEVPEEQPTQPAVPEPEPQQMQATEQEEEPLFRQTTACPFRKNPYHTCVPYCKKTYGMREWNPDSTMLKRRERMLRKYPVPQGWVEVGDLDTSRYYYWNMHTDQVSWLSPSHPRADISQSAEQLGLIGKIGPLDSDGEEAMEEEDLDDDNASERSSSDTSLSDEEEYIEKSSKIESRLFKAPPVQSKPQETKKSRGKADELDPMDPASYSDIARGGWSDGLDLRGKAKTGVDETASGPLFQQRPYPSPGDILRANQSLKKKK